MFNLALIAHSRTAKREVERAVTWTIIPSRPEDSNLKRDSATTHNGPENSIPIFKLGDATFVKLSLTLCMRRLARNSRSLFCSEFVHCKWIEYGVKATNYVSFDDLCGDIGDEDFLKDLMYMMLDS